MKVYLVGGSVRDKLLGKTPKDNDFLITDVTHDEMIRQGFQAVGKEHTVYLHPGTKDEYSVARSLYTELERRDLTINAMAMLGDEIIDYFDGKADLQKKRLRHVREENIFHDPLRIYRIARFASELPEFSIVPETLDVMERVSKTEKFRTIDPERIFSEMRKALASPSPDVFFSIMINIDAICVHLKEISASDLTFLHKISLGNTDPVIRFASLFIHASPHAVKEFCQRLKTPVEWEKAAEVISEGRCLNESLGYKQILEFLYKIDVYRRPQHLWILIQVMNSKTETIQRAYDLTKNISINDIQAGISGRDAGLAIKTKRLSVLESSGI